MQPTSAPYRSWTEDSVFPSIHAPFFLDHVTRYYHARNFIKPTDSVLDVACGKGYGSAILASAAKTVVGIDLNETSLDLARRHFIQPNLTFQNQDVMKADQLGQRFDVITAYEIIEHLDAKDTDQFLAALKNSLKPGGKLLLSTPNHEVVLKAGVEVPEFHINNLTSGELSKKLRGHFPDVRIYGQYRRKGGLRDLIFHLDYFSWRHQLLALHRFIRRGKIISDAPKNAARTPSDSEIWSPGQVPTEVQSYRFSPWVWKQAGLTFAVCTF